MKKLITTDLTSICRRSALAVVLLLTACSSQSGIAPTVSNVTPQIFQKQPFNGPWLTTALVRNALPNELAIGAKGYIWVADRGLSAITRVDMKFGARQFPVHIKPTVVTVGPDQNVWLANDSNVVARVTPTGSETDFTISPSDAKVAELVDGSDGALWFSVYTESQGGIGRLDTSGNYTFYPLGYTASPLTAGPDGNLWFMDGANLNAMNTQGQIVAHYPFTGNALFSTVGPDGAMWFTSGSSLIRATTAGEIQQFSVPVGDNIYDITSWGGQLWMTNNSQSGNMLLSFNPVTQAWGPPIPSPFVVRRIIIGQDGNFWMTGLNAKLTIYVIQALSVTPSSLTLQNGKSGTLTVTETNYDGKWKAQWIGSIVNVVQTSPGMFTVTGVAPGMTKVTIQDTMHNFTRITVTVQR